MGTRLEIERYVSFDRVKRSITSFTEMYDISYLLRKYANKNFWVGELQKCFAATNIENLTDFNYSKSFNYALNEGDLELSIVAKEFREYVIAHGSLDRVLVMISALAPFVVYRCVRYEYKGERISMKSTPDYGDWQKKVDVSMSAFCKTNDLFVISDSDLKRSINNISLELHGPNPSVFNLFFEDGSSDFPY
jgi:hypothetical protein